MSGSTPAVPPAEGADPSMEDILASIRRILNEDEAGPSKDAAGAKDGAASAIPPTEGEDGVLVLDEAMLVTPPPVQTQEPAPGPQPEPVPEPVAPPGTEPIVAALDAPPVAVVEPPAPPVVAAHAQEIAPRAAEPGLMGPESAAARGLVGRRPCSAPWPPNAARRSIAADQPSRIWSARKSVRC